LFDFPLTFGFSIYNPPTNGASITSVLATNQTRWLATYPFDFSPDSSHLDAIGVTNQNGFYALNYNANNWFGLPFLTVKIGYNGPATVTIDANNSRTNAGFFYPETAQPRFQNVEYDFFNPNQTWDDVLQEWIPAKLPGSDNFDVTNQSQQFYTTPGNSIQVAGYAKLAVTNSAYTGVYGYLGQYFDKAYKISNGIVTTNTTGVLSAYGNFFATEPGDVALVTMPDVDTGERGTGIVHSVSLQLDKNHDGEMDLSFSSADTTSPSSPFIFWRNNNFDRWNNDGAFNTPEQDDLLAAPCEGAHGIYLTDCDFVNYYGYRAIPCARDLEDFARLWVGGVSTNLLAHLPANSTITLSWGDAGSPNPDNPTIDVFTAVEVNGGVGYLTNSLTASNQVAFATTNYIGRLAPGQTLPLYSGSAASWHGSHYIWCGVSNGVGQLTLTLADGQGNLLAQTSVSIEIKDIKQFYERWTVGDDPGEAPQTVPTLSAQNLPEGAGRLFMYDRPSDATTPYILHVHGYNMPKWAKDRFAETAYKRLYWQGYQGRFGAFNWPTAENAIQFGNSELQAWQSGLGLYNKLQALNTLYPGNVYLMAHSLGNVAAGEALRLAGTNQVVNTYIAMQGAVSAHAYDPTTTAYQPANDMGAPDCYAHYWTNGAPCYFNASAGAGTYVNFYNTNDWALRVAWLTFQDQKQNLYLNYAYIPINTYFKNLGLTELFFPDNRYEIFNAIIQSRSYALGMQPDVGGAFQKAGATQEVNLRSVWPPDPLADDYKAHIWHSAEFRSDAAQRWQFWNQTLIKMSLKQPQQ
jgi:hypothetical protein